MCEEACFIKPGPDWLPRLMVIDGCNIGRSACGMGREAVNCAGLMAVIRWLLVRDFDVVAFLPVVYNNSHNFNAVHVHLLAKLEELGLVTFTPARTGRGDRKAFINYDDLYVTTLAARHGGCVLSGDKFKDILAQSTYSEFHPVILNRTLDIKFRFLPHEVVHHGADVFYKALPELFIYEDVTIRASVIARKIFASPEDPEFSKKAAQVLLRRESWTEKRKEERISAIDDMISELCERNAIRPLALENLPGYNVEPLEEFGEDFDAFGDSLLSNSEYGELSTDSRCSGIGAADEEVWASTSSTTRNQNHADDFSLIDFSDSFTPFPSHVVQPSDHIVQQPLDPFDIVSVGSTDVNSWISGSNSCGDESNSQRNLLDEADGQLNMAYSQEDVLREIAAHIDTLILTRDRLTRREFGSEESSTPDLISFFDKPQSQSDYTRRDDESVPRGSGSGDVMSQQNASVTEELKDGLQRPANDAFSEEEISYTNTPHDEDEDFKKAVVDSKIETTLSSIFPADIVQQVLAVNASRNIDFLAGQCAEMCA